MESPEENRLAPKPFAEGSSPWVGSTEMGSNGTVTIGFDAIDQADFWDLLAQNLTPGDSSFLREVVFIPGLPTAIASLTSSPRRMASPSTTVP